MLSIPMLPNSGGTLAAGAAGTYNEHFRRLAHALDAYVDYVGSDVYDQAWVTGGATIPNATERWNYLLTQPYGLNWLADFAAAHGKPITLPEWGLITRPDGHGGGDNPYFIEQMHRWILSHSVAYAIYFQFDTGEGASRLTAGAFPSATKVFLRLFGAGS